MTNAARRQPVRPRLHPLLEDGRRARLPVLPDPAHDPRDRAGDRRARREWREASSSLGASSWQFWRHIGVPILLPSILGAVVLLFGNSFAAYATAYGLTGGGVGARADHDRLLPKRQRPRRSAPGAGARVRHVRRARVDDARLHAAAARVVAGGRGDAARGSSRLGRHLAPDRRRLLPHPAVRDARLQHQGRPQTGEVLHRSPTTATILHDSAVLEDDQAVAGPRARDDRDHPRPARADRVLGAPEAAATAPRDRVHRARPVRRAADHPRRRPARRLQGHARLVLRASPTASSSPRT